MLTRLQTLSDDHFGYAPDEVTWSHIGTLEHYADLLKRITDSAFNEGEHAEYGVATASPEQRRMITFDAIAPDGTMPLHRLPYGRCDYALVCNSEALERADRER